MLTLAQVMAKKSYALRQDKFYRMRLALRDEPDYSNEPSPETPQSPTSPTKPVINVTYQVDGKSTPVFRELEEKIKVLEFMVRTQSQGKKQSSKRYERYENA